MNFFPFDMQAAEALCRELDEWRAKLDTDVTLQRRWYGQLRRDLEAEAIAASVSMEQVPVTVDEVRRILLGVPTPSVALGNQRLVLGYKEGMEFAMRRADDPSFEWNRELVIGLHDRVLAGDFGAGAGRLAAADRWVVDQATHALVFTPVGWQEIPEQVDRACRQMQDWEGRVHPAVASAWIHAVTAAIHPFKDGNGRVSRVLASLAMFRGGLKAKEFTSLEEWWGRRLNDYYAAFACLGDRFDPSVAVTPFIEAHIRAQLGQVRALDLRKEVERRVWAGLEHVVEDCGLKPRTIYALWEAFYEREVTASYYLGLAEVSKQTATNDFVALVAAGLLLPRGERGGRRYASSEGLYARLGRALGFDVPGGERYAWIIGALTSRLAALRGMRA